ncbi:GNAT family N-acetyltransferase [Streptomyces acidiscabies]|uniref:GNAT family N-acetyltransferase n=1 Tax=Streptomyces acidiscabies TaxID=42234 RepID=UPI000E67B235|nr:GNAT family N-acetyltransferase [Streptomyces acidiscabies]MBP5942723.1 GNAT family N-acetyltransferase [Streptomyces sp. LBUM 1476]
MGKRNGARKGARRSGNPARREAEHQISGVVLGERMYSGAAGHRAGAQPGEILPVRAPVLPDGVVLRDAARADRAALEPVIRLADPDNPDGSWRALSEVINQSLDPGLQTYARVVEETSSGALVGGMLALPATWAFTHPMLIGSPNAHIIAGLVGCLDSLAVVDQWRGKGIARALVTDAERAVSSHSAGKLGSAVLLVTHEPELTDFYAGLGFTVSPDGIGIPTPTGFICHGPTKGFRFSVKPLRTGVQMKPMATPYGRQLVIQGVLPLPR